MTKTTAVEFVLGPEWGDRDEIQLQPDGLPPRVLWRSAPDGERTAYLRRHHDGRRAWIYAHEPHMPKELGQVGETEKTS